jgi:hypothetical protein
MLMFACKRPTTIEVGAGPTARDVAPRSEEDAAKALGHESERSELEEVAAFGCPSFQVCVANFDTGSPRDTWLTPGRPIVLEFSIPGGCFSSTCSTRRMKCERDIRDPHTIQVAYCVANAESDPSRPCTLDCGGGGPAHCYPEGVLERGTYRLRFDDDELVFKVPSQLPFDGPRRALCGLMWRGRKIPH